MGHASAYVAHNDEERPPVTLLLLLSAMLSALTGVGSGGRTTAPLEMSRAITVERAVRVVTAVATRPVQPLPRLIAQAFTPALPMTLVAAAPLYASRRRE